MLCLPTRYMLVFESHSDSVSWCTCFAAQRVGEREGVPSRLGMQLAASDPEEAQAVVSESPIVT